MGRYRGRVPPYHLERGAVRAYIGCRASVADALRTCQRLVQASREAGRVATSRNITSVFPA